VTIADKFSGAFIQRVWEKSSSSRDNNQIIATKVEGLKSEGRKKTKGAKKLMGKGKMTKPTLMKAMVPFFFQTRAMRAKELRAINGGVKISVGENVGKGFKNSLSPTPFLEIIVNQSNPGRIFNF
jgi:hypothetical protein